MLIQRLERCAPNPVLAYLRKDATHVRVDLNAARTWREEFRLRARLQRNRTERPRLQPEVAIHSTNEDLLISHHQTPKKTIGNPRRSRSFLLRRRTAVR